MSNEENKEIVQTTAYKSAQIVGAAKTNPEYLTIAERMQQSEISGVNLEGKDYLALFIALLQTVFAPLFFVALIIIAIAFLFRIFIYLL